MKRNCIFYVISLCVCILSASCNNHNWHSMRVGNYSSQHVYITSINGLNCDEIYKSLGSVLPNGGRPSNTTLPKKITHYLLSSGFLNFNHLPNYLPLFTRLSCRQSIWQFSIVVLPPLLHGIMWSASISSNLKVFPHLGQTPFCCS